MPNHDFREELLIAALLTGATVREAAAKAGIHQRTAQRWLADPAGSLRQRLEAAKKALWSKTVEDLAAVASKAVGVLRELLDGEAPPAVRLGAARAAIEYGMKSKEFIELAARVAALEQQQAKAPGQHPQGT
jgi:hypothetical protein